MVHRAAIPILTTFAQSRTVSVSSVAWNITPTTKPQPKPSVEVCAFLIPWGEWWGSSALGTGARGIDFALRVVRTGMCENVRNLEHYSATVSLCIDVRANYCELLVKFHILRLLVWLGRRAGVLVGTESGKSSGRRVPHSLGVLLSSICFGKSKSDV